MAIDPVTIKIAIKKILEQLLDEKKRKQIITNILIFVGLLLLISGIATQMTNNEYSSSNFNYPFSLSDCSKDNKGDPLITSPYGERTRDNGKKEFHKGIDFATKKNCNLLAVLDGEVVAVGHNTPPFHGYGNCVMIKHTIDKEIIYSFYAHMSNITVKIGDKVKTGTIIGQEGNTGDSEGDHLHFEVRKGDGSPKGVNFVNVDPAPYFTRFFGWLVIESETGAKGNNLTSEFVGKTNDKNLANDPGGGVSYGLFQFSSKQGIAKNFSDWLKGNTKYNLSLEGEDYNTLGGTFYNSWKMLSSNNTQEFAKAQIGFAKERYYDNVVNQLSIKVDITKKSEIVQEAVFSCAINLGSGGITSILKTMKANDNEKTIINNLYDGAIKEKPFNTSRFNRERDIVLNYKG